MPIAANVLWSGWSLYKRIPLYSSEMVKKIPRRWETYKSCFRRHCKWRGMRRENSGLVGSRWIVVMAAINIDGREIGHLQMLESLKLATRDSPCCLERKWAWKVRDAHQYFLAHFQEKGGLITQSCPWVLDDSWDHLLLCHTWPIISLELGNET